MEEKRMLELPETLTVALLLRASVWKALVAEVRTPTKPHKFCWFSEAPEAFEEKLKGSRVVTAEGFGIFAEILFENGYRLCFNDGVNVRLLHLEELPKDYQLAIVFADGRALVFNVAMYGGIYLHQGDFDNPYYLKSRAAISPFDREFAGYYRLMLKASKPSLSLKAFLAAEQRFPGIGNGVLQDILLSARLNPRRKIGGLTEEEGERLLTSLVAVLKEMTEKRGRDTERTLFGDWGRYETKLSKKTFLSGCPVCGGQIVKETYLGGVVYYCPHCQPLGK